MTKTYTLLLILALGAPAAAELAAPELPFIDAAVVRSQPFEMVMVPAGGPKAAAQPVIYNGMYTNDSGCIVEVENGAKGMILSIDKLGHRAMLGVLNGFSGGDITAFCRPAEAAFGGGVIALGCKEQDNGGYPTRGYAEVDLRDGFNAVRVRGQVKRVLGWSTDTDIVCEGLHRVH